MGCFGFFFFFLLLFVVVGHCELFLDSFGLLWFILSFVWVTVDVFSDCYGSFFVLVSTLDVSMNDLL